MSLMGEGTQDFLDGGDRPPWGGQGSDGGMFGNPGCFGPL